MADVERFVDTAASAGGDGTTRNHTGGTRAYASLSAWESAEQADLITATDTHRVRCAGSTADTTGVTVDGFTTDASFFVTIQGDDAATDSDGFYSGEKVWSTGHYRLDIAVGFFCIFISDPNLVIDGIQLQCTRDNSSAFCVDIAKADAVIKNCRVTSGGLTVGAGINGNDTTAGSSFIATNNIVFDINGTGILAAANGGSVKVFDVYNNTVFDCVDGIEVGVDHVDLTYNFFNNALFNNTNDMTLLEVSSTVNHDWNAGEDAPPTNETNGVTIGTLTDAMVDPSNATKKNINCQVKDSSSTLFKASRHINARDSNTPLVDIVGNTRSASARRSTSIGAWANIREGTGAYYV